MEKTISIRKPVLGIELGSTRVKAVLIGPDRGALAAGACDWASRLEDGYWTYSLDDVREAVREAFRGAAARYEEAYGEKLTELSAIGISAMMHGYLAFDDEDRLITPFRTWQNTNTREAAEKLSALLAFNMPQRWSVSHYYQALLNREPGAGRVRFLTTLSGYVHRMLSGEKILGAGDAAGMFPLERNAEGAAVWSPACLAKFNALPETRALPFPLEAILPEIRLAGEPAGYLTPEGALYLDPAGTLQPGAPLCPPEGDAGTGMTCTNSVAARTGNVSVGTSIFAMIVLEKPLRSYYPEIDIVATPSGRPAAMVHCNNGSGELDAWLGLLREFAELTGAPTDKKTLYETLYHAALKGAPDASGIMAFNFTAGEPIARVGGCCPLVARTPGQRLSFADFCLAQLYAVNASLRLGMDILREKEGVTVDTLLAHGGVFKTPEVMQRVMASCLRLPAAVFPTAGEGGAWGIAVLAAYMLQGHGKSLESWLSDDVFRLLPAAEVIEPDETLAEGFEAWLGRYQQLLGAVRLASDLFSKGEKHV